tara:strand:+ start:464 stop:640 length:177 start_codon:yes stop_codon:yes gene_type:complete
MVKKSINKIYKLQVSRILPKLIMILMLPIILNACGVKGDIELEKEIISESKSILDRLI